MNIKKDIFENNAHPFTVPEGYFDSFQDRIMNRIQTEERCGFNFVEGCAVRVEGLTSLRAAPFALFRSLGFYRTLIAAAACILFIFTIGALYVIHTGRQPVVAETVVDDDFFRWVYTSDRATLFAESLDIHAPETIMANEHDYFEEDEAIINFLERDNISIAAILMVSD